MILYNIGYEGKSIQAYIEELGACGIRLLCDVRKNAISRKPDFSKNKLREHLNRVGIEYIHMPDLGIESSKRKKIRDGTSYQKLFSDYRKDLLEKEDELRHIVGLLKKYDKVALTCFEADPAYCHRHVLAEKITDLGSCSKSVSL